MSPNPVIGAIKTELTSDIKDRISINYSLKSTVQGADITIPRIALAKWLYLSRDIRPGGEIPGLFGEPAWDMLLDLYIHQNAGALTSVSSACIASRSPNTTALRYIGLLSDSGWIERVPDEADKRRSLLALTPEGTRKLDSYLARLLENLRLILPQSLLRELVKEAGLRGPQ